MKKLYALAVITALILVSGCAGRYETAVPPEPGYIDMSGAETDQEGEAGGKGSDCGCQ